MRLVRNKGGVDAAFKQERVHPDMWIIARAEFAPGAFHIEDESATVIPLYLATPFGWGGNHGLLPAYWVRLRTSTQRMRHPQPRARWKRLFRIAIICARCYFCWTWTCPMATSGGILLGGYMSEIAGGEINQCSENGTGESMEYHTHHFGVWDRRRWIGDTATRRHKDGRMGHIKQPNV